ncbi:hypothetical protein, partial [Serratia marcescens]|uniref:hypothetical protein n=1 Tax=Serratia marcescens TaxID=615 RepID=UPI001C9C28DC
QKAYGLPEEVSDEGSFYLNPIYSTKPVLTTMDVKSSFQMGVKLMLLWKAMMLFILMAKLPKL